MKEIIEHKIAELEAQGLNGSAEALVRQGQVMAYREMLKGLYNGDPVGEKGEDGMVVLFRSIGWRKKDFSYMVKNPLLIRYRLVNHKTIYKILEMGDIYVENTDFIPISDLEMIPNKF